MGGTAGGKELVIVGLDFENLDRLRAGAPAQSDLPGLPTVILHAAPTLRDVVEELVEHGVLPEVALTQFKEPDKDEARIWSADDPEQVQSVRGQQGDARDLTPAAERRRARLREAILDVIAPKRPEFDRQPRMAVFEWPKETTPTDDELLGLADELAAAVERVPVVET